MSETATPMWQDIFATDVTRKINGVIKANDDRDLADEVNEYVLTDEIQRNLERFLDDYNDPTNHQQNGAWISGFFGSGKSHLLKMLSHILGSVPQGVMDEDTPADQRMTREQVLRAFITKAGKQDNLELQGQLERVRGIDATSILFNIDQKADKSTPAPLLYTFIRVFDEARGYFGRNPAVAKFERDLDNNG